MKKGLGVIYIVSAPSGAGKTSLVKALVEEIPGLRVSVSHTTRPKRPGEIDGVHYHFVTEKQFQELNQAGAFVESATVFGYHYATSKAEIETATKNGDDVVLDIDWQGAKSVAELFPEQSVSIFLLPPSKKVLQERLEARGQDDHQIITSRMTAADSEMAHYKDYQYLIINDHFGQALNELICIVKAARLTVERQKMKRADLIETLVKG
jgi:guanylate kinase